MFRRSSHFRLYCVLMLSVSIVLSACDSRMEWQDGAFQLRWIDTPELFLVYTNDRGQSTTLIEADVIGIGSDEKHIIVHHRDHRSREISYFLINKAATNLSKQAQVDAIQHLSEVQYRSHPTQASWPKINQEFHYP